MQMWTLVVVTVAMVSLLTGCSGERSQDERKEGALVSVVLNAWNEHVQIDARAMTIVHTQTEYEYASPTSGNPTGSKLHKLLDGKITPEQRDALGKFIRESGFMDLKDAYGAPEGQRYYPYRIEVTFEGQPKKVVEFRSNPSFENEPESFKKLETYLRQMSQR